MSSIIQRRKEKMFLKVVSDIIEFDLINSNLSLTTVTRVQLSNDGKYLKVFVIFENQKTRSLEVLNNSKGFIRKRIAEKLNPRFVPEVAFFYDTTSENAKKIDEILEKLKQNK